MSNPMRDFLEERERTLEKRVAELERALQQIIGQLPKIRQVEVIARKALGLTDVSAEHVVVERPGNHA
jgi:hypothetical protein